LPRFYQLPLQRSLEAIEATLGAIPVLGDLFDAAWQANHRNLRLAARHYAPRCKRRSLRGILVPFALTIPLFLLAVALVAVSSCGCFGRG